MSIACVWNARNVRETDVLDWLLGASMMPHQTAAWWKCGPTTTKTDLEARVLQPWHPMWSLCCKPSIRPDSNIKEQSKDVACIANNELTQAKHVKLKHVAAQKLSLCEAAFLPTGTSQNGHWRSGEASSNPASFGTSMTKIKMQMHFKWPSEDNMTTSQNSWSLRKTSSPWRTGAC